MTVKVSAPTVFLKARSTALCCLVFINLLWVILLCLLVFTRWEVLDYPQKYLLISMLVTSAGSAVVLLVLLLVDFRPWLDAARVGFLLIVHIGLASAFAYWSPKLQCLTHTLDQEGVCQLIITYLLIASWFIPGLLILYTAGLVFMVWKRSRSALSQTTSTFDEEATTRLQQPSAIADINVMTHRSRFAFPTQVSELPIFKLDFASDDTEHSQVSIGKRLSKPSPVIYF